jgi:hypothetical protein
VVVYNANNLWSRLAKFTLGFYNAAGTQDLPQYAFTGAEQMYSINVARKYHAHLRQWA